MTEENKLNKERKPKKTKIIMILLALTILIGFAVDVTLKCEKSEEHIEEIDMNITIKDLKKGKFNKEKALEDYYRLAEGKLPKYAKIDKEETIEMYCKDYEGIWSEFISTDEEVSHYAYFKGEDYSIEVTFNQYYSSWGSSCNAYAKFKDSTGKEIDRISGRVRYDSKALKIAKTYKNHPKVRTAEEAHQKRINGELFINDRKK